MEISSPRRHRCRQNLALPLRRRDLSTVWQSTMIGNKRGRCTRVKAKWVLTPNTRMEICPSLSVKSKKRLIAHSKRIFSLITDTLEAKQMCSRQWILKRLTSHQIKDTIRSANHMSKQIIQEQRKSIRPLKPFKNMLLYKQSKVMNLTCRNSRPCKCLQDVSQRWAPDTKQWPGSSPRGSMT